MVCMHSGTPTVDVRSAMATIHRPLYPALCEEYDWPPEVAGDYSADFVVKGIVRGVRDHTVCIASLQIASPDKFATSQHGAGSTGSVHKERTARESRVSCIPGSPSTPTTYCVRSVLRVRCGAVDASGRSLQIEVLESKHAVLPQSFEELAERAASLQLDGSSVTTSRRLCPRLSRADQCF